MTWHTPHSWLVGENITARHLNEQLRDNSLDLLARVGLLHGIPATVDPRETDDVVAAAIAVANRCVYSRVLAGAGTASGMIFGVGTSNGTISVAVYDNTNVGINAGPVTRQQTSGSVACPASGHASVAFGASVGVSLGWWFALSTSSATNTFHGMLIASGCSLGFGRLQETAHPAPSTASSTNGYEGVQMPVLVGQT